MFDWCKKYFKFTCTFILVDLYTCISKFKVHINGDVLDVVLISKASLSWRILKQLNYLSDFFVFNSVNPLPLPVDKAGTGNGSTGSKSGSTVGTIVAVFLSAIVICLLLIVFHKKERRLVTAIDLNVFLMQCCNLGLGTSSKILIPHPSIGLQ